MQHVREPQGTPSVQINVEAYKQAKDGGYVTVGERKAVNNEAVIVKSAGNTAFVVTAGYNPLSGAPELMPPVQLQLADLYVAQDALQRRLDGLGVLIADIESTMGERFITHAKAAALEKKGA